MGVKMISLFLLLILNSPIKSDEATLGAEVEGNDSQNMEDILDMLNTLEDGGYDKKNYWVDYDYSQDAGISNVLITDLSFSGEDSDYPLNYDDVTDMEKINSIVREKISTSVYETKDLGNDGEVTSVDVKVDDNARDYDYAESSEISETIVETDEILNLKEDMVHEYQDVDYESLEEAKIIQVTMDDLYDQSMIFHIILLLGICLICVVVFFALVTLIVTVLTRRHAPASNAVRSIKIKSDGIVKSYAKIPVEIKNMVPSNIAYKQLYDV